MWHLMCRQSSVLVPEMRVHEPEAPSVPGEFSTRLALSFRQTGIGCALTYAPKASLRVTRIDSEGAIWAWNRENADREIRIGDCIVEVDGIRGDSSKMLKHLRTPQKVYKLQLRSRGTADIEALHRLIQARDITPDDFELLALLDGTSPSKTAQGAVETFIQALPRIRAGECGASECAVCLSEFEPSSQVTRLPCAHCYCTDCISTWLTYKTSCPFCQKAISLVAPETSSCEPFADDEFNAADFDEGIMLRSMKMNTRLSATKWKDFARPSKIIHL